MVSKAEKRRRRRNRPRERTPEAQPAYATANAPERPTTYPTPERMARGRWQVPTGSDKRIAPHVDMTADVIGRLHWDRHITDAQEQAARTFQALRAAYLAEFPDVVQYKSCLAGSVPGFDDGDGDAEIIAAYRSVEAKLERPQRRQLLWVCDQDHEPTSLADLCAALDVVARC